MNSFTIKDLENLSGIKAHTLRIWEQRYNLIKPNRTETNIRYYCNEELKKLLNIALLNKFGYKISHIDKMSEMVIREKILSLNQLEAQQERVVNELIKCMVDLNIEQFEEHIDQYIAARGIERTITQIVFPFLEKVGILWMTNHINPAQEHLVTNIVRQKIIVGIETVSTTVQINKTILLFLPEGEHHELGLLFMYFIMKKRGAKIIYLGANIPMHDVKYVINLKNPDFIYCHLTAAGSNFNFEKFLNHAAKEFNNIPVIVSGNLTSSYEKKIQAPLSFKRSFAEAMEFAASL